jgi:hypothetical protein
VKARLGDAQARGRDRDAALEAGDTGPAIRELGLDRREVAGRGGGAGRGGMELGVADLDRGGELARLRVGRVDARLERADARGLRGAAQRERCECRDCDGERYRSDATNTSLLQRLRG